MMVEPSFNELTISKEPMSNDKIEAVANGYIDLLTQLKTYGIKKVRYFYSFRDIYIAQGYSLEDYCGTYLNNRQYTNSEQQKRVYLLLAMQKYPAFQGQAEEKKYEEWSDVTFSYQDSSGLHECTPDGLYQAYLFDSFTIGFNQGVVDKKCAITLKRTEKKDDNSLSEYKRTAEIFNITCKEQCLCERDFAEYMSKYPILINFRDKKTKYSLTSHHGFDRYGGHADLLFADKYVVDVLSTISFDSRERRYIHQVYSDGRIEVRLHWEKAGYGLLISTMGEDLIQTYWIAKYLENKYSR